MQAASQFLDSLEITEGVPFRSDLGPLNADGEPFLLLLFLILVQVLVHDEMISCYINIGSWRLGPTHRKDPSLVSIAVTNARLNMSKVLVKWATVTKDLKILRLLTTENGVTMSASKRPLSTMQMPWV